MIRRFLIGALWLILAPTLTCLAFAAYAYIGNSFSQTGALQTSISPAVVFPWQMATYRIDFSGETEKAEKAKEQPVDFLFMIDVSGSMTESLPVMSDAAHNVTREL